MNRRELKANACVEAYRALYSRTPTKHAVIMICAVAEHETNCGDAWNHSGCWGAVQRRQMTAAEKAIVKAGGVPPATDPFEGLHGDSSPINGKYQAWYWHFPAGVPCPQSAGLSGDAAGCYRLLKVLLGQEPETLAAIDWIDASTLASNMYRHGYYEGMHDPRQPGGKESNIADYAHAIGWAAGAFTADLAAWTPDGTSLLLDLHTVAGVQVALNKLGADPALKVDGVFGPKSRRAVQQFQVAAGLKPDGIVGKLTRAALEQALQRLPSTARNPA